MGKKRGRAKLAEQRLDVSRLTLPWRGPAHWLALVGVTYVLSTLDRNLLLNAGTLRPTRAILPPGTVMNCAAPAAVGMRSLTCALSQIATIGVFSQAIPDRLPANSPGGNSIMNIRTSDAANRSVVASLGPVGGGAGGTPRHDGPDGSGGLSAFLKNTPIEINEAEVPIHFHRYGLTADSAGAGRYRGGLATEMVFEIFAPDTLVTARNRNRSVFASAGVLGGQPGGLSHFRTLRDGEVIEHGNTDVIRCQPGDIVEVRGPGAGGYGLPVQRDEQAVLSDVRCGFVSHEAARAAYGVVIVDDQVDQAATAQLRSTMRQQPHEHFDHGAARNAFEALWTPQRYQLLTRFLAAAPVGWRHFLKQQVFKAVAAGGDTDTAAQMHAIFADLRQRYPAMNV